MRGKTLETENKGNCAAPSHSGNGCAPVPPGKRLRKGPLLDAILHEAASKMINAACESILPDENARVLELLAGPLCLMPRGKASHVITGVGPWPDELHQNGALAHRILADLDANPSLPIRSDCFDAAVLFFGVETLRFPGRVFEEVSRVLRPGAVFLNVYSSVTDADCANSEWRWMDDQERLSNVVSHFERTEAFGPVTAYGTKKRVRSDASKKQHPVRDPAPIWITYAKSRSARTIAWDLKETLGRQDPEAQNPLRCPYCGEWLRKYAVPHSACEIDYWYEADHLYICFNDVCPYFERGWEWMWSTMRRNVSYRHMYNPTTRKSGPIPVPTYYALKDGIVEEA